MFSEEQNAKCLSFNIHTRI